MLFTRRFAFYTVYCQDVSTYVATLCTWLWYCWADFGVTITYSLTVYGQGGKADNIASAVPLHTQFWPPSPLYIYSPSLHAPNSYFLNTPYIISTMLSTMRRAVLLTALMNLVCKIYMHHIGARLFDDVWKDEGYLQWEQSMNATRIRSMNTTSGQPTIGLGSGNFTDASNYTTSLHFCRRLS